VVGPPGAAKPRSRNRGGGIGPHRDIRGAVVVITGASSGIGEATALAFAGLGARLALAAGDPEALGDERQSLPNDLALSAWPL
jgi:NADP-dependent 3-hydroxy acid dehydrogenase YdfG